MNYKALILSILLGFCFKYGDLRFVVGASVAGLLIALVRIAQAIEGVEE